MMPIMNHLSQFLLLGCLVETANGNFLLRSIGRFALNNQLIVIDIVLYELDVLVELYHLRQYARAALQQLFLLLFEIVIHVL